MGLYGWFGKTLRLDLSTGSIKEEAIEKNLLVTWLGGRGLGAHTIFQEVPPKCDPLGDDNKLVFACGPLTGTDFPGSGRFTVSAKSPLTGTIFDANAGGTWGVRLKGCGYDRLIIEGKANAPVFLAIKDGKVSLEEAGDLWGKDTSETTESLTGRFGKDASVACIGRAGENQVRFATIIYDGHRALGRGGLGAVMGAKKLKAILVSGKQKTAVADPGKMELVVYEANKWVKANPITSKGLPEFGTPVLVKLIDELGVLPVRNFNASQFSGIDNISGETIADNMYVDHSGCEGCPVQCTGMITIDPGTTAGPEYEALWALGPECDIDNLAVIAEANTLCHRFGLDAISAGVTIGCAMELAERSLLKTDLKFGDIVGLLETIKQIANREDLGALLAGGSRRFAERMGFPQYSMQVKGLELPAYDPRGLQGMGLAFATSNRGACHFSAYMVGPEALGVPKMTDRFATAGKAGLTITQQNINAATDSLSICHYMNLALSEEDYARALAAATGLVYQARDLHYAGERIWNLERLYNLRAGIDPSYDTLPLRLLEEPVESGPSMGRTVALKPMLAEYYRFRGWDETGIPTPKKLQELELGEY